MSLIKNLIKEPEPKKKNKSEDEEEDSDEKPRGSMRPIIKSVTDLQRLRLEKLMKNPEKPVQIPESRGSKSFKEDAPPAFVRNVMGSSAGAGSGEFHVYRHLRRKEYARQKNIQIKSYHEQLDQQYQEKLEENRRIAEEKTAKKRAKRLKKKQRAKQIRKDGNGNKPQENVQEESLSSEESCNEEHNIEKVSDTKSGEGMEKSEKDLKEYGEKGEICREDTDKSGSNDENLKRGDGVSTEAETLKGAEISITTSTVAEMSKKESETSENVEDISEETEEK